MTAPNGAPLPEPTPWAYPFTGIVWKITFTETTDSAAGEGGQGGPLTNQTTTAAGTEEGTTTTTDGIGDNKEDNEQANGE